MFSRKVLPVLQLFIIFNTIVALAVKAQSPEKQLQQLLQYCSNYKSLPIDSLGKYSRKAVTLATQLNHAPSAVEAWFYMGRYYLNTSQPDSATAACDQVDYYNRKARVYCREKNSADVLRGIIFIRKNQHKAAIEWFYKIIKNIEARKDTLNYLGVLNGIGLANMELLRYEEAKRWFLKVIQHPAPQYESNKVVTYCNIASTYGALNKLDSCEKYIVQAIDLAGTYNLLTAKANALNIYADLLTAQKKYEAAEASILKSIEVRRQIGDPFYIVSDMAQLSGLYAITGRYDKGIYLGEQALTLARDNNIGAKFAMIYQSLFENYYGAGNYKKSADIMSTLSKLKDSLNNKATAKGLAEMEVKYETAKKEHQIQEQKFELAKKNYWITGVLVFLLLSIILFYVLHKNYQQKQQRKLQQAILKEQEDAAKAVINTEENERTRMSQTLHDGVGQLLSALKMNLQALGEGAELKETLVPVYHNSISLVDESVKEIRNVSHQIVPNNVIRLGLGNALKTLVEKIDNNQLKIHLDIEGPLQNIAPDTQLMVYRILQEIINNVIKHARADTLNIVMEVSANDLQAIIEDNGVGFDKNSLKEGSGIGLDNIASRIRYLKGRYRIDATPGKGTKFSFRIPVKL